MYKKVRFITACVVGAMAVLAIIVLNNFKYGRRFNEWILKL